MVRVAKEVGQAEDAVAADEVADDTGADLGDGQGAGLCLLEALGFGAELFGREHLEPEAASRQFFGAARHELDPEMHRVRDGQGVSDAQHARGGGGGSRRVRPIKANPADAATTPRSRPTSRDDVVAFMAKRWP